MSKRSLDSFLGWRFVIRIGTLLTFAKKAMRTRTIVSSMAMIAIAGLVFASGFTPRVVGQVAGLFSMFFPVVALPTALIGLYQGRHGSNEKKTEVLLTMLHVAAFVAAGYFLFIWISFFASGGIKLGWH